MSPSFWYSFWFRVKKQITTASLMTLPSASHGQGFEETKRLPEQGDV